MQRARCAECRFDSFAPLPSQRQTAAIVSTHVTEGPFGMWLDSSLNGPPIAVRAARYALARSSRLVWHSSRVV